MGRIKRARAAASCCGEQQHVRIQMHPKQARRSDPRPHTLTRRQRAKRRRERSTLADDRMSAAVTVVTAIAGPDVAPPEAFERDNVNRILAMG